MTKKEILKKIGNARYAMRLAMYRGESKKALMYDDETEKLIKKAEKQLKIEWHEIESALLDADETAEMVNEEL